MDRKPPKAPSLLKRDENNNLIESNVQEVTDGLTKKLISESRDFQRENSFRHAMTNRRDIVVKVIIYQKNTVNGMVVRSDATDPEFEKLSDDPLDPFRYKMFDYIDGEILAKEMPMPLSKCGKWQFGMFKALSNYLARMNVFNNV